MRAVGRYPSDAVKGGCFILGRYEVRPGEQVIDTQIAVEDLPAFGQLCISADAVRSMCGDFGWALVTDELAEEMAGLMTTNEALRAQIDELINAMAGMVNLPAVERALDIAARKVAGKESIQEWVDTLPRAVRK
jgi:uncharacterized protein YunC (DUF1805 family)